MSDGQEFPAWMTETDTLHTARARVAWALAGVLMAIGDALPLWMAHPAYVAAVRIYASWWRDPWDVSP